METGQSNSMNTVEHEEGSALKIDHKEYLERVLKSKKLKLEQLKIEHRINIATYETKVDMLHDEIASIENQLIQ